MRKGTATRSLVSSDLQPPATVCVEQLVPILLLVYFFIEIVTRSIQVAGTRWRRALPTVDALLLKTGENNFVILLPVFCHQVTNLGVAMRIYSKLSCVLKKL